MEVEAAKSGGLLPGLAYLQTVRGVNPIGENLPYGLQKHWITHGSRYKEEHRVSFPPFSSFVSFITDKAKIRNYPSFSFSSSCTTSQIKQDKAMRPFNNNKTVSVRNTEVTAAPLTQNNISKERKAVEPADCCPMHNKQHPLAKCCGFQSKHLDDRKAHLKENSICFRRCASTQHFAKDCLVSVKCKGCNSDRHISALQPGPAPWSTEAEATEQGQVREQERNASPELTSKCTEICDQIHGLRSCSKITLMHVYPASHPDKAQKMYAVLDDQSNRSLAKTDFFELFDVDVTPSTYTLKTCAGISEATGRKAHNFVVVSLDGQFHVALFSLLECNAMPDDRSEIPTPEIVPYFPHLAPAAGKIPP